MKRILSLAIFTLMISLFYQATTPFEEEILPPVDYVNDVRPIVQTYCVSCHGGDSPSGGFALSTYKSVRYETEKGNLLDRINNDKKPMPKKGLMSWSNRQVFQEWAYGGYLYEREELPIIEEDIIAVIKDTSVAISPLDSMILPQEERLISSVKALDVSEGIDLLSKMEGHWIGNLDLMGEKYDWFAFDYRLISQSHVFGIYEGGSMGNIFTSFFVADFKGTTTIMARNGGVLNEFYRTSYFVLDEVQKYKNGSSYYRFVDAYGDDYIMYLEITFSKNGLMSMTSYTSHFGMDEQPTKHMEFQAEKVNFDKKVAKFETLATSAEKNFNQGITKPNWGPDFPYITSASYIFQSTSTQNLDTLAAMAKDIYPRNEMPYLSKMDVSIEQNEKIKNESLILYLSNEPLVNSKGKIEMEYGYIKQDLFDEILHFPTLNPGSSSFSFEYLHPGEYYITIVADKNQDRYISAKDIVSISQKITIESNQEYQVTIEDIVNKN